MIKKILLGMLATAAILTVMVLMSGCLTSKQTSVTNGVTNVVVTVNQTTLALDCAAIQFGTGELVSQFAKNPQNLVALNDAKIALDGILTGATTNNTQQALALLKLSTPALQQQAQGLINAVSQLEQQLLAKYGATVTGEITLAIATAIDRGFATGLGQ